MEQAVRERRRLYGGIELPIECYNIRTSPGTVGQIRTPHYHDYIEFLYAAGECDVQVWVDGENVSFKTGDFLIINANVAHSFRNQLPINSYICIKALPEILSYSENSFFDVKYVKPFSKSGDGRYEYFSAEETAGSEIGAAFTDAMKEWIDKDYGYEMSLKSQLYRIFLWTIRKRYSKGEHLADSSVCNNAEHIRLIQRAAEYINLNYATADEAETAAYINLSYSHFSRLFSRVMGKSFKDYLMTARIGAAERMLLESDLPVTEVALNCGFATSSHFIERFKQVKGVTPRQYRKIWIEN